MVANASGNLPLLYRLTHSGMAKVTCSKLRLGPRDDMTSTLQSPLIIGEGVVTGVADAADG